MKHTDINRIEYHSKIIMNWYLAYTHAPYLIIDQLMQKDLTEEEPSHNVLQYIILFIYLSDSTSNKSGWNP